MGHAKKPVLLYFLLSILVLFTGVNVALFVNADHLPTLLRNEGTKNPKIRLGFSLGTLKEERWLRDRDILLAKAKESGAEIYVQNANNDDNDQLNQVKYLLSKQIDVLIIVPNDLEKASEAVRLAQKNGVKVISYDRLVMNANVDLYLSFDNFAVGRLMAQELANAQPDGNYVILNGALNDNNARQIKQGYESILNESVKNGKIKLLSEVWAQNWLAETGYKSVDELLQKQHNIDAVLAGNDSLAGAAIEALAEYRLAGKVKVVGQDADLAACQRVVEGTQLMTVYKPIDKLAELTVNMAIKLARGENINIDSRVSDGTYTVPYQFIQPIAVTKENMAATVIKDGFQNQADVYGNMK